MAHRVTWILVADGGQAFAVTDAAGARHWSLVPDFAFHNPRHQDRDLGTDGPPRVFRAAGDPARSAMGEPDDMSRRSEATFLADVASALHRRHAEGAFVRLVIAAPPRALGQLREAMPPELSGIVTREIAADLIHETPAAIGARLEHH